MVMNTQEKNPKLSERKMAILEKLRRGQLKAVTTLNRIKRPDHIPLSYTQQRLWLMDKVATSPIYHLLKRMKVTGALKIPAIEQSFNELIRKHEILRTSFQKVGGELIQVIEPELKLALQLVDLGGLSQTEIEREAKRLAMEDFERPFDLERVPLLRVIVLRFHDNEYRLLLNMHHMISDAWSAGVITQEISFYYRAYLQNQLPRLTELPLQYADYVCQQRNWMQSADAISQLDYWKRQLAGADFRLHLPAKHLQPGNRRYKGSKEPFSLPQTIVTGLHDLSRRSKVTLFICLLAAFNVLLYHETAQQDIIIGSPIAKRDGPEAHGMIGPVVNALVLRTKLAGNLTFAALLEEVRRTTVEAFSSSDIPIDKIIEILSPADLLTHSPFFNVVFSFQNIDQATPDPAGLDLAGLKLEEWEVNYNTSKFDLFLSMQEWRGGLYGTIEYNTDIFTQPEIALMIERFKKLLESIIKNPGSRLSSLN
jgi:Condensation domain